MGDQLALRNYGLFLRDQGRLQEAEQYLNQAFQLGDARVPSELAELYEERNRPDDAKKYRSRSPSGGDD